MTKHKYRVEQVTPQIAHDDIIALWRDNLGAGVDPKKKFDWIYGDRANPPADIYLLYADSQPEAVGACGLAPRPFNVDGQIIKSAVLCDLVVNKHHRALFPAMLLLRTLLEEGRQKYGLIYALPNRNSKPLSGKLGYQPVGQLRRFSLVVNVREKLAVRIRSSLLSHLVSPFINGALRILTSVRNTKKIKCTPIKWDDPRIKDSGMLGIPPGLVAGAHTLAVLNQRFANNPRNHFELIGFMDNENILTGYGVIHTDASTLSVDDLQIAHGAAPSALMALAQEAAARKLEAVHIELLDTPATRSTTKKAGFKPRESREMFYCPGNDSPLKSTLAKTSEWYITSADEDQ